MVYEAGEALSSDQFERLQEELKASFGGAENAGRPMLLEGGLHWQALSLSPADMDFIALKAAAARDIALAFGVPPMLLGLPGDATYANYREANRALWRQTILPLAGKLLSAIAQGLGRTFPGATLGVDLDRVTELSEDRERLWAQVNTAGFLTLDEKREAVGLEAVAIGARDEFPETDSEEAPVMKPGSEDKELQVKFNPYHDPRNGQFTFAPGGLGSASVSRVPSAIPAAIGGDDPNSPVDDMPGFAKRPEKTLPAGRLFMPPRAPKGSVLLERGSAIDPKTGTRYSPDGGISNPYPVPRAINKHGYKPQAADLNTLARALFSEGAETQSDYAAIGSVIINRVGDKRYGRTLDAVLNQKLQFEFMEAGGGGKGGSKMFRLSANPEKLTGKNL